MEAPQPQAVSNTPTNACTNACTNTPKSTHEDDSVDDFAEALALIERLPLSDAEKAEAVRRLLKSKEVGHS